MRVLIIGSRGMLGQELVKVFSKSPFTSPFFKGGQRGIFSSLNKGGRGDLFTWDLPQTDITDQEQVNKKISDLKPDIVINAAAYNDVDGCEKKRDFCNLINGYAVGYLAKACQKIGAIFVQYSSDYVFKGDKKAGYKEGDQPAPQSAYASSKFLGEWELQKNCEKYYLIRTSRLFGKPAASQTAKRSFVDKILEAARQKDELEVIDEEYSSPTYAPDLAERTFEIIDWQKPPGIYHATNDGACTWYGFAQEIFKIMGIKKKLIPTSSDKFPRPAVRPKYSQLLNTKLPPIRSWQEALKEYLKSV